MNLDVNEELDQLETEKHELASLSSENLAATSSKCSCQTVQVVKLGVVFGMVMSRGILLLSSESTSLRDPPTLLKSLSRNRFRDDVHGGWVQICLARMKF
jgi:hypothetical protein